MVSSLLAKVHVIYPQEISRDFIVTCTKNTSYDNIEGSEIWLLKALIPVRVYTNTYRKQENRGIEERHIKYTQIYIILYIGA